MSPLNSPSLFNVTIVRPEFFYISGFAGIPHTKYYYVFLCLCFALTLLGNTFIMFVIYTDHSLHTPKYIVVFNLAVSDLCGSTALVPQMIDTFLFKSQLISYKACLTNMFFVFWFGCVQSLTLTALSYDRCVAICLPLRYNEIVTSKSMLVITAILWIFAGTATLIAVIFISRISFCKSIVVNSYFCDQGPMHLLACNDNTPSAVIHWTHPVIILWLPVLFITGTYISIARALFKIAEASERLKAMKTCTSHLILSFSSELSSSSRTYILQKRKHRSTLVSYWKKRSSKGETDALTFFVYAVCQKLLVLKDWFFGRSETVRRKQTCDEPPEFTLPV
ncbi:olfactory receptor 6F1-like [Anguilla anguilla]|uniref:olfactory receptor 6F1-like n=1 Tax=Anguilla anguilla TaxID=7936 RepID=UPI0015AFE86F|nr:olfactory receptor 6F1-like [Anguilla anguilla]